MKKLLFILSIIICSSCDSKFDGLQGGIFGWADDKVTFDDDKAYLTVSSDVFKPFYLSFNLYEPNSKIINDFTQLFEKYNLNESFYSFIGKMVYGIDYETARFEYTYNREKLNFIFDYKKVGQNQILLTKPTTKPNYSDYYEFKRELEILINKYENDGYVFNDKTILNFLSFIQGIENDYLKSNYYLNKVKDGYTLENLEHKFYYKDVR